MAFDDLLAENKRYADHFDDHHFNGKAEVGVLMLTCMDSRIEPLAMIGQKIGSIKILRTPGAFLTPDALGGCIVGVHKLGVNRIMVVAHTRCAMASQSEEELLDLVARHSGTDIGELSLGADPDQRARLSRDVEQLRNHPLIGPFAEVGGFMYDVDWGRLTQVL